MLTTFLLEQICSWVHALKCKMKRIKLHIRCQLNEKKKKKVPVDYIIIKTRLTHKEIYYQKNTTKLFSIKSHYLRQY